MSRQQNSAAIVIGLLDIDGIFLNIEAKLLIQTSRTPAETAKYASVFHFEILLKLHVYVLY